MPKASLHQTSFNAGELSPLMNGRSDVPAYKNGCQTLENFIPLIYGPAKKRNGTRYVNEVKTSADAARLIPFQFSTEQSYVLEFGDLYFRVYKDGAVVLDGGSEVEVVTPYDDADLAGLSYTQSADVIYLAHEDYPPQKISRTSDTAWTITEIDFNWPPFGIVNKTSTTIVASAATGTVSLTASAATFDSMVVGDVIRFDENVDEHYLDWSTGIAVSLNNEYKYNGNVYKVSVAGTTGTRPPVHTSGSREDGSPGSNVTWDYLHSGSGFCEITVITDSTNATATVTRTLPSTWRSTWSGLYDRTQWTKGAWSSADGYPKTVAFYEDRLWWGGNTTYPQTLWASVSGDYENHEPGTADDKSLNYTINSQQVNAITWMSPGKVLTVGTTGSEFVVSASSIEEAITPGNIRIVPQTTYGSTSNRPWRIGNSILFVQRSKKEIREFNFRFENDSYSAYPMTVFARHILNDKVKDISYQKDPDQVLWVATETGELVGMTYEKDQEVIGWHRHDVNGTVEGLCTIPHWDGDQDVLFLLVNRTIDGGTVRYIEYMEKELAGDYAFHVDCGLTYDGSASDTITGLDHLEGESVSVLADGTVHPNVTVTAGQIILQAEYSIVNIGYGFTAKLKTMPLDGGAADGATQGKTARITNLTMRLDNTGPGLRFGCTDADTNEVYFRDSNDLMDEPVPLFTGDTEPQPMPCGYEPTPSVYVEHYNPLPCTIVSLMPQTVVQDRG